MRKGPQNAILAIAVGVFVFSGWIAAISNQEADASIPQPKPLGKVLKTIDPFMSRMVDCEDFDIQPCYTLDEGRWRIVLSYAPYKSIPAYDCTAEDGGKKLPCVWKRNNKKEKKSDPDTRNVFWKGKLG